MPDLYVTAAHPNPPGKDRPPAGGPTNAQLNQEWVEFSNSSGKTLNMSGVTLTHETFNTICQRTGRATVMAFSGSLQPDHSVRVHTGSGTNRSEGTLTHLYADRGNYVWNNYCGDRATLYTASGGCIDWAEYARNPREGHILRRVAYTNTLR